MTSPVPEDVMEKAREALVGLRVAFDNDSGPSALTEAIARAILAERRRERARCAKIVEQVGNFGDYCRDELTPDYGQPRFDLMTEIAAAIRGTHG